MNSNIPIELVNLEKELTNQFQDIQRKLNAVRTSIELLNNSNTVEVIGVARSKYDENANWNDKVLFAIKELGGSGFVKDIVECLKPLEKSKTEEFLLKRVTITASTLLKDAEGPLYKAGNDGRAFKYALKNPTV